MNEALYCQHPHTRLKKVMSLSCSSNNLSDGVGSRGAFGNQEVSCWKLEWVLETATEKRSMQAKAAMKIALESEAE